MEVDFLVDFIESKISGAGTAEIKFLTYRDGGVELSPGNIAPCYIPERLLEHKRDVIIHNKGQLVNTPEGTGSIAEDFEGEMTVKGILKDGDTVIVAKITGERKYLILERVNA